MGDGDLSPPIRADGAASASGMGHGAKQVAYLDWKASLFGNIGTVPTTNAKGAGFVDLTPLPELAEICASGLPRRRARSTCRGTTSRR